MSHFHKRICNDRDNNYKIVSDDLYKNGIFDNNDNEIANNIARRVTILYNKNEMYEKFDIMLKEVDEEYRTTFIDFAKYKLVLFTIAKIMEMQEVERNKVSLYLFNSVNI